MYFYVLLLYYHADDKMTDSYQSGRDDTNQLNILHKLNIFNLLIIIYHFV
jgi:hypothetical protein